MGVEIPLGGNPQARDYNRSLIQMIEIWVTQADLIKSQKQRGQENYPQNESVELPFGGKKLN